MAVKAQAAVYGGKELPPCRSKCRLVGESVTGWRDELVNVKHATGKHGLIGEIQIVRSKMLLQRETMGGYADALLVCYLKHSRLDTGGMPHQPPDT